MTRIIFNQTLPIVTEIVDNVLEVYPQPNIRDSFTTEDSKLDLATYVLNRTHSSFEVVEEEEFGKSNPRTIQISQEEQIKLEALVHEAILYHFHKHPRLDHFHKHPRLASRSALAA